MASMNSDRQGFTAARKSRSISGGGKSAGQLKDVAPGKAGMRKAGMHKNMSVGGKQGNPAGSMAGKGKYC